MTLGIPWFAGLFSKNTQKITIHGKVIGRNSSGKIVQVNFIFDTELTENMSHIRIKKAFYRIIWNPWNLLVLKKRTVTRKSKDLQPFGKNYLTVQSYFKEFFNNDSYLGGEIVGLLVNNILHQFSFHYLKVVE